MNSPGARPSRFKIISLIAPEIRWYFLGSALMGAMHWVFFTFFNLHLDGIGLDKLEIGFVQGADSWGRLVVALPAAFLLAHRRTPPIFAISALVTGLVYVFLPWLDRVAALSLLNGLAGFMGAVHYVAMAPFLFRHSGWRERAAVFGISEAVHQLAAVLGALTAGWTIDALAPLTGGTELSMRWVLSATGALGLGAALAYRRIAEDQPPPATRRAILPVLRDNYGVILRFTLPQLIVGCGSGLCIPFLALYFKDRFGFRPEQVGTLFAGGQLLMATGFLLTPWIIARLGFVRGVVCVEWASIPFFLVLALTGSVTFAVVAYLFRGALMNTAHPMYKNLMMQASPDGTREVQNGMTSAVWGLGWVVGPYVGGAILDATGNRYELLMFATVCLYLVGGLATLWLLRPLDPTWKRSRSGAAPTAGVQGGGDRPEVASVEEVDP